jgi:CDGSH-type Zn-finger protein
MPRQLCPYIVKEKPRTVAWCACGESAKDPYCDGSHARNNTGKVPVVVDLECEKTIAWCGCKEAASRPYCNGSHAKFQMQDDDARRKADLVRHEAIGRKNDRVVRDMDDNQRRWEG